MYKTLHVHRTETVSMMFWLECYMLFQLCWKTIFNTMNIMSLLSYLRFYDYTVLIHYKDLGILARYTYIYSIFNVLHIDSTGAYHTLYMNNCTSVIQRGIRILHCAFYCVDHLYSFLSVPKSLP